MNKLTFFLILVFICQLTSLIYCGMVNYKYAGLASLIGMFVFASLAGFAYKGEKE